MKKKIIILDHKGGRLCNQLWNYISVYAYCLEKNYQCHNYSFYKYDDNFNIKDKNLLYKIFLLFNKITLILRKNGFAHRFYRNYINHMETKHKNKIVDSMFDFLISGTTYLSPTPVRRPSDNTARDMIEKSKRKNIYLEGWLFRNPVGIEKYRREIKEYFLPKKKVRHKSETLINSLRSHYKHVIGVHMRQGDYKGDYLGAISPAAKIYLDENQVNDFLHQYLLYSKKDPEETCFVICSDDPVRLELFKNLNMKLGPGGVVEDLYALSLTDIIIGSNSTFGAYASYYGNIPLVVFDKNGIDWEYYHDKTTYFENKYCKVVNF